MKDVDATLIKKLKAEADKVVKQQKATTNAADRAIKSANDVKKEISKSPID